ncbi:MAG: thioredoxin domain-containing protein [Gemmatimonadetes bacterium]|nr:thioredoxin domain-containing protein [Gemmatimonadota bacterium]
MRAVQRVVDGITIAAFVGAAYLLSRPGSSLRVELDDHAWRRQIGRVANERWAELVKVAVGSRANSGEVDLIEVTDYQCPYCRRATAVVDSLEAVGIRVAYLHVPPPSRPMSHLGAIAAVCAEDQSRLAPYHRLLMADTTWYGGTSWESLASRSGIDSTAFVTCLQSDSSKSVVSKHADLAKALGVRGTPTFVSRLGVREGVVAAAELERLARKR